MTQSLGPRKATKLAATVDHQLNRYAVAATAAGVGMLVVTQPAEAKIVYTPANVLISGKPLPIDLNHDGINDFFLFHYGFHTSTGGNALLVCLNPFVNGSRTVCASSSFGTNAMNAFRVVESKGGEWGAAVQRGAKIIGGDRFRSAHSADLGQITFPTSSHQLPKWAGPWMNGGKGVKNRFVGIRFSIKGRFHYGWARVTVKTQEKSFSATLTGYAYETVPGKGIIAGRTKGPDVVDSEPATLGHLARGASSLSDWRGQ